MKPTMKVSPNAYIAAMDRLEFADANNLSNDRDFTVQLSIAISLKRIADALEKPVVTGNPSSARVDGFINDVD